MIAGGWAFNVLCLTGAQLAAGLLSAATKQMQPSRKLCGKVKSKGEKVGEQQALHFVGFSFCCGPTALASRYRRVEVWGMVRRLACTTFSTNAGALLVCVF